VSSSALIEKCCLIGPSLGGDPTHFMVERVLGANQLDWRFVTFEVQPTHLADALRGLAVLGFRGALLAPAFRAAAVDLVGTLDQRAKDSRSVSCLIRTGDVLVGHDLEGAAVAAALAERKLASPQGCLVLGANRAGRSIATALIAAGQVNQVYVADLDPKGTEKFAHDFGPASANCPVEPIAIEAPEEFDLPEGVRLIVSALPAEDRKKWQAKHLSLRAGHTLVDVTRSGERTILARDAAKLGAEVIDGLELVVLETKLALEAWSGEKFDGALLRDAAEEFMGL
jgi:shikimate dehydrogenase